MTSNNASNMFLNSRMLIISMHIPKAMLFLFIKDKA